MVSLCRRAVRAPSYVLRVGPGTTPGQSMRSLARLAAGLLAAAGCTLAVAEGSPGAIALGPYRAGMTATQIRDAAPGVDWMERRGSAPDFEDSLFAKDVISLGGIPFELTILRGRYGATEFYASGTDLPAGVEACEARFAGVVADLETRYGPLANPSFAKAAPDSPAGAGAAQDEPRSRLAGSSSTYSWDTTKSGKRGEATRTVAQVTVHVVGSIGSTQAPTGGSGTAPSRSCGVQIDIVVPGAPPPFESIAAEQLRSVVSPSLALLQETAEGLDLPPEGRVVVARCKVSRILGFVEHCKLPDTVPPPLARAVMTRVRHVAYEATGLDPGNPTPLYASLEFRFEQARPSGTEAPSEPYESSQVLWSEEFASVGAELRKHRRDIPSRAGPVRLVVPVTATCRILEDGSLSCPPGSIRASAERASDERLRAIAENIERDRLRYRRAGALSKSGSATAGRWVAIVDDLTLMATPQADPSKADETPWYAGPDHVTCASEAPGYPTLARRLQEEGIVQVRYRIDEHGFPAETAVVKSSGSRRLDNSTRYWIQTCRFLPALDGAGAGTRWVSQAFTFHLLD